MVFTFSGPVRGTVTSAGLREFLGIPYATPPVGNLRWRPPLPSARWFAPREATNEDEAGSGHRKHDDEIVRERADAV